MHANLMESQPIFTYKSDHRLDDVLSEMMIAGNIRIDRELRLISLLYSFLSLLVESAAIGQPRSWFGSSKDYYIKAAAEYIRMNYSRNLRVEDIASYLGINRSYLGSIFQQYFRLPTSQYLLKFRMDKACEFMSNPELSISDIARSVGYEDALLFSRMFKKLKSVSPRAYRKQLQIK
jgi:AraC-like DNA-binding protein